MILTLLISALSLTQAIAQTQERTPTQVQPPVAKAIPFIRKIHDTELPDDYAWMTPGPGGVQNNKELLNYLKAENRYADQELSTQNDTIQKLRQEFSRRTESTQKVGTEQRRSRIHPKNDGEIRFAGSKFSIQKSKDARVNTLFKGSKPVFEIQDPKFHLEMNISSDQKYLFVTKMSYDGSEVYYFTKTNTDRPPTKTFSYQAGITVYLDHFQDSFYVQHNAKDPNFQLYKVNDFALLPTNEFVHTGILESFCFTNNALFTQQRVAGMPIVRAYDLQGNKKQTVGLDHTYSEVIESLSCDERFAEISISTFFESEVRTQLDEETGGIIYQEKKVTKNFSRDDYEYENLKVKSTIDQAEIPVTLLHKKGIAPSVNSPLLLAAYGAYGDSYHLSAVESYSQKYIPSLLDRGVVFAIAHVRGGGELGNSWYQGGKLRKKMNTFSDFQDVVEALIDQRKTSAQKLILTGYSAGGLVMGYAINNFSRQFKAAYLKMPFVDLLNTMLNPSIPMTEEEYFEWGNPNFRSDFHYMRQYCPYSNLVEREYPALLIKTGYEDENVLPHEPAKFAARIRALNTGKNSILLRTIKGDHFGNAKNPDLEFAKDFSWLLDQFGI